eukprot:7254633-Prymnesium_polylepis.1
MSAVCVSGVSPSPPLGLGLAVCAPTLTARARIGGRRQSGKCNGDRRRRRGRKCARALGGAEVRQRCGGATHATSNKIEPRRVYTDCALR